MKKILVIDDDDLVRNVITKMLEREGFKVITAVNGKEGVELFYTDPADLVITDLIMPEKDGIETILELKKAFPEIKIIAISGGGQLGPGKVGATDYLSIAKAYGASCILTKPVEMNILINAVNKTLQ
jgi:CheY-like chemotaxis protein